MLLLLSLISLCLSESEIPAAHKTLPSVYLRPKPKARAGGADAEGAAVYSFGFISQVRIGGEQRLFTLSIGILMENIWVTQPDCEKCKTAFMMYNESDSNTSVALNIPSSYKNNVLNLDLNGTLYTEDVTIEEMDTLRLNISVANRFVDVLNLAIDGIIGFGTDENSIVYEMYNQGLIDEPIYSLSYLNSPYIIFGTPNFKNLSLVVDTQQTISFKHALNCTYFEFGHYSETEVAEIEFNSISSYITGPFDVLEAVFKILVDEGCHYEEELLMCDCHETEFSHFSFEIQGELLNITSEHYLIALGDNCFVALKSGEKWILGEPFMKAYFMEINLKEKTITLSKTSALEDDLLSPFETQEGITVMIGLAIASLCVYIFAYFIYVKYEDYKKNQALVEELTVGKRKPRVL